MSTRFRCTEWSRRTDHGLGVDCRRQIVSAVEAWRTISHLPAAPLSFGGPDGDELCTRQYVGVIEVDDVTIKILPKLDAPVSNSNSNIALENPTTVATVMQNLLWMMEVADHRTFIEGATAHLQEEPTSFFDVFGYLLGRNLLPELERGVAHSYVRCQDNLSTVRGRIGVSEQVRRNWNRFDRLFCIWDEFTVDTSLNQLFKCACRFLADRVRLVQARNLLLDCEALLMEVEDVPTIVALQNTANLRMDRSLERFKTTFDLAVRLLAGTAHNLGAGDSHTFVFLVDMNELFEAYVCAVLESHFDVTVRTQVDVGRLLNCDQGGIAQ